MTPIALYPSDRSLKKSAGIGGFALFIALQFKTWSSDGSIAVPLMFAVFGLAMVYPLVKNHLNPAPSFEADADGFSVMGKPKRSWDEYRGAKVHTTYMWFIPISRSLIIKTGKNILGGRVQINPAYMSGPVKDMASDIETYARHAQRKEDLNEAMLTSPASRLVRPVAPPADRRHANPMPTATAVGHSFASPQSQAASGSPVQSVPKLSDRLFKGRKVI
ncbi:hypothetical protein SAMN05444287_3249 [Octadecabacter temperatus]|uniref:Uncharacterized protein n=1 Tax=Octadecabacter temperatus TaxID=1458307 RepID=A0A0K0Y8C0_9RHOB|nr:hypothetical protein [Octadecabacter temperatus]AKS47117.1 hypothetical protein OSB_25870 [Octadecabacter temperatus]SIO46321.1 hypothetical protein SAMN05444287_3249 [Octadecabacter temperatus]